MKRALPLVLALALHGCAASVPQDRLPAPAPLPAPSEDWSVYGKASPERAGTWGGASTWKHPPASREADPASAGSPAQAAPAGPAPAAAPAAASIGKVTSAWADQRLGEEDRTAFDRAAKSAAVTGSSTYDGPDGSRTVIALSSRSAGCASVEVTVMSPGGKLPVLSRGLARVC